MYHKERREPVGTDQSRHRIGACDEMSRPVNEATCCEPSCPWQEGEAHACRDVRTESDWLSLRRGGGEVSAVGGHRAAAAPRTEPITAGSEGGQGMAAALLKGENGTLLYRSRRGLEDGMDPSDYNQGVARPIRRSGHWAG